MSLIDRLRKTVQRSRPQDPNARLECGRTPLMMACRNITHLKVQDMLSSGADPCLVDDQGNTALHHAFLVRPNEPRGWMCATGLVRAGAVIDAVNNEGETPMLLALRHMVQGGYSGYQDQIRFMIEHGANLLLPGTDGQTPAHLLAANQNLFDDLALQARSLLEQVALEAKTAPAAATSRPKVRL